MALSGPDFYDDEVVSKRYRAGRDRPQSARDVLEKRVFDDLLWSLGGRGILNLGCRDARLGREALDAGCELYTGVEGSRRMAELARTTLGGTAATTRVAAQVVAADITNGYP